MTLSPIELEALSRLSHEAVARFSEDLDRRISRPSLDPESPRDTKGRAHISEQIVQQPAFERQKPETNGHTSVANGHNISAMREHELAGGLPA